MDARSTRAKVINHILSWVFFAGALVSISLFRIEYSKVGNSKTAYLAGSVGSVTTITGSIDEPTTTNTGQHCELDTDAGVNILVSTGLSPVLVYGDKITVTGRLETPQNFTTDQGTEFDYVSYLYKDDILYLMPHAKIAVVSHGNGSWLIGQLIPFKQKILNSFARILPADEADLLGGLILGSKSNISAQFRDDLVATGTIHIIALSGYNVTIVANTLRAILSYIPSLSLLWGDVLGGCAIILFVLMTGAQSSAIRAGIMALIGIFARTSGRSYDAFRALAVAAIAMILWNPKYLVYDVSFQLSFLATFGIIFITPILEERLAWLPEKILRVVPLRETVSTTLGAQLSVLPFILYKMGTLSLIALPANMLVLPVIPLTMGIGALAGFVGMVSENLAYPFAYVTSILLKYISWIITTLAHIPWASVVIHYVPAALCVFLYAVMGIILYWS